MPGWLGPPRQPRGGRGGPEWARPLGLRRLGMLPFCQAEHFQGHVHYLDFGLLESHPGRSAPSWAQKGISAEAMTEPSQERVATARRSHPSGDRHTLTVQELSPLALCPPSPFSLVLEFCQGGAPARETDCGVLNQTSSCWGSPEF